MMDRRQTRMPRGLYRLQAGLLVVTMLALALAAAPARAEVFETGRFQQLWTRTDQLVASGAVARSWIWGPEAGFTALESYNGGKRVVQYFEKSRMELNERAEEGSPWVVTNGLLARELATGKLQIGDAQFESRAPAAIPVAGDLSGNADMPTYAQLGSFDPGIAHGRHATRALGSAVSATWSLSAGVGESAKLAQTYPETKIAFYDDVTGQNISGVFWSYFGQAGDVLQDGRRTFSAPLFDWLYVMGRPISAPYWVKGKLGGQPRDILVQLFERRVVTYTPSNPQGWKVEMSNVGTHYVQWRYGHAVVTRHVDCAGVRSVNPSTNEGKAIAAKVLAELLTDPYNGVRSIEHVSAIDEAAGWITFQAWFEGAEPAILLLKLDQNGYALVEAWGGITSKADDIRGWLARKAPDAPPALISCLVPHGHVTSTVEL